MLAKVNSGKIVAEGSVKALLSKKVLVISYQTSLDESGNPVLKNVRYSNINMEATDDEYIAFATAISALCKYSVNRLFIEEEHTLAG